MFFFFHFCCFASAYMNNKFTRIKAFHTQWLYTFAVCLYIVFNIITIPMDHGWLLLVVLSERRQ